MKRMLFTLAILIISVSGCGNQDGEKTSPANTSSGETLKISGFGPVGVACDGHGHRVFTKTEAVAVIDDVTCPGGAYPTPTTSG